MIKPLIVMALEMESRGQFAGLPIIHTGLGKVNATLQLSRHIMANQPTHIINLGTAGSTTFTTQTLVHCRQFIQRDMDVTPLGFAPYQTPYDASEPLFTYGEAVDFLPAAICGTGDNFDTSNTYTAYNVVDMEAFAYAKVAQAFALPFTCIKFISDGADATAGTDWQEMLEHASIALRNVYDKWLQSHRQT